MLEGYVLSRELEYRLQLDFAESPTVQDAFIQWRFRPAMAVRAGQFKVPFGFQRHIWSAYYEFVDLSEAMSAFSLERDVGVMIAGRPFAERLLYQVSVTNGAGQGKINDNLDLAYAVRVVAAPFGPLPEWEGALVGQARPLLAIGGSAYYSLVPTDIQARTGNPVAPVDVDGDGRVDNVEVWQGGLELRALWRGAALQAEYFQRHEHPGVAAADRDTRGGYAQASYFLIPGYLQLAARIGRSDLPLYGATLVERQLRGDRVDEQSGAANLYLRRHDIKLQVDYSHLRGRDVVAPGGIYAPDTHRVRAQVQLMF
jgi:phosphate-selective porin OprO/OprP